MIFSKIYKYVFVLYFIINFFLQICYKFYILIADSSSMYEQHLKNNTNIWRVSYYIDWCIKKYSKISLYRITFINKIIHVFINNKDIYSIKVYSCLFNWSIWYVILYNYVEVYWKVNCRFLENTLSFSEIISFFEIT